MVALTEISTGSQPGPLGQLPDPPAGGWQLLEVPEPTGGRDLGDESPHRAAAAGVLPALIAAHGAAHPVVSAWVRGVPLHPVVLLQAGLDASTAHRPDGLARLVAPGGGLGRGLAASDWAERIGADWSWQAFRPVFDPLTQETADAGAAQALPRPGAGHGGPEDAFELFAGSALAWVVVAEPVPDDRVEQELNRLTHLLPSLRNRAETAEHHKLAVERAEGWFRELAQWRVHGWWNVMLFVGGRDPAVGRRAAALLTAGSELRQTRYVVPAVAPEGNGPPPGWVCADLVAALVRPPVREVAGVRVTTRPDFDATPETFGAIRLGDVLDANLLPCGPWSVPVESLNRHLFVCGATGSGKSHTVRSLLEELSRADPAVPWLVIEPAKAEYAAIAGRLAPGAQPAVLRPGDPAAVPVGVNPLQPEPGFPIQTHLDLIRALFMAAFEAEEPFPQVLARALVRCYEERHWNLALGEPARRWAGAPGQLPAWPTLADLQAAARKVVDEIGYGREARDNVRGFIDVRVGSLRLGSAGRFFEGGHPLDVGALLDGNVVIELENLGSDEEKAFLIGVVLIRLIEHLRLHRAGERTLRHVTVIEEAHRLLRNSTRASAATQAVTMFADLLAEIRAYGEGVAVVEQIPSKIIPDVVKNSAVKVMHRLPARDDREFVGATMNLDPAASRYVVQLTPGTAAFHIDGMDRPCLARATFGAAREARAAVPAPPPIGARRLAECGELCRSAPSAACSLRQIGRAEEMAAASAGLALWVELELVTHLLGGGYRLPAPERSGLDGIDRLDRRLQDCAIGTLVHRGVQARYRRLGEFYDPAALGRHLSEALGTWLTGEGSAAPERAWVCPGGEPGYQAGPRRFVDVLEALKAARSGDPVDAGTLSRLRDRGLEVQDPITAGALVRLLREHRWARYPHRQELYWGAGSRTPLDEAVGRLAGTSSPRTPAAVWRAMQAAGLQPQPWLVDRLCPAPAPDAAAAQPAAPAPPGTAPAAGASAVPAQEGAGHA